MAHLSEDDLILRYYGETDADDTARTDAHLKACAICRDAWADLTETMKLVDAAPVPEPGPAFERVMWARVQQALPPKRMPFWSLRRLVPAAGLAATVVALVGLGWMWRSAIEPAGSTGAARTDAAAVRERVLLTALDGHFEQTEMLLVELMNAPGDDQTELAFERSAADDLVTSGRLYRATAEQNGDIRLVRVLEEIETVLVDVARSPQKIDPVDLQSLRGRIDDENLLFKVRAVTNEIRGRQQSMNPVSEGPL
ncbi:MAG TPA: hypothetical protein VFO19_03240 [Vicinamibacterales bacterium]|nr:hypothetical protein [Vicinamibacterales bacterium]